MDNQYSIINILLVDDNERNLLALEGLLQSLSVNCVKASSGKEALKCLLTQEFALILLDVQMPEIDGFETAKIIRKREKNKYTPIIFVTAYMPTEANIFKGYEVGAVDYIVKPIVPEILLSKVKIFIQIFQQNYAVKQEIQEHKRTQEALFIEKELAQVTLKSIGDAVITTNTQGYVTYLNPMGEYLTGWSEKETQGRHLCEIFAIVNETTKELVINPIFQALEEVKTINLAKNTLLIGRDGREFSIDDSASPIRDREGNVVGAVIVFRDITESHNFNRQLSWQASHDNLTGLINRMGFELKLEAAIASAQNEQHHHVLCYLDLDQFKVINDTCGHAAGDELLRQISKLLQQRIRESDTLARLGGDEFAFLLHQCDLNKATEVAEETRQMIEKFHFAWNNKTFNIGVSIGVVLIDHSTQDNNTVLGIADAACYAAKARGRNCIQIYQDNDYELLRQRKERLWVVQINQALEDNRFCLYYQKVTPIKSHDKPIYNEILLRLLDEKGKLILPNMFIPAGERYGLMPNIDRWVISTFFNKYRDYHHQNQKYSNLSQNLYALNISGASINHDHFIDFLKEQFEQAQVPPHTICFEITETTAIANFDQAIALINELKQLGCCFALDDFGHGMNSFDYIKYFPVDFLKIDGSFVLNLVNSEIDHAIVESFNRIGHVMNLQTIAEFVENTVILKEVEMIGVDYAQGYAIAKPVPFKFENIV